MSALAISGSDRSPRWLDKLSPIRIVVLLTLVGVFAFSGTRALNDPDEGRYALTTLEMVRSGNWLIPHLCGVPRLQKPPLLHWISAAAMLALGTDEWVVRLPSTLAALGTVWMTMLIARRLLGVSVAWKAGLILVTSLLFFVGARLYTPDMLLTFWITSAIAGFVSYATSGRWAGLLGFYLAMGLGFLTKGPMALIVPLAAAIPLQTGLRPAPRPLAWKWHWLPGLLLTLSIGLSWFLVVVWRQPELVDFFLRRELVDRLATNEHGRAKPFWFYGIYVVSGMLPWSLWLPRFVRHTLQHPPRLQSPSVRLLLGWTLIPLLILQFVVSKLATYLLPLFPAFAILTAWLWHRSASSYRAEMRWTAYLFSALSLGFVLAAIVRHDSERFVRLTPGHLVLCALIGLAWIVIAWSQRRTSAASVQLWQLGGMMLVFGVCLSAIANSILPARFAPKHGIVPLILKAKAEANADDVILISGRHYSLQFYLGFPMRRKLGTVDLCVPLAPEMEEWFWPDLPERVLQKSHPHSILVSSTPWEFEQLQAVPHWRFYGKEGRYSVWVPRAPKDSTSP